MQAMMKKRRADSSPVRNSAGAALEMTPKRARVSKDLFAEPGMYTPEKARRAKGKIFELSLDKHVKPSLDASPKKAKVAKESRVQVKLEMQMVAIPGVSLEEGETVIIKNCRSLADEKTLGVFDKSLGIHVGWLPDDIVSILAPWLKSHRGVRIMPCRVLASKKDDLKESCSTAQPDSTLASDGTKKRRALGACMEVIFSGPLSVEAELQEMSKHLTELMSPGRQQPIS